MQRYRKPSARPKNVVNRLNAKLCEYLFETKVAFCACATIDPLPVEKEIVCNARLCQCNNIEVNSAV